MEIAVPSDIILSICVYTKNYSFRIQDLTQISLTAEAELGKLTK